MTPDSNIANRLALGLMAAKRIPSYDDAVAELQRLSLRLICDSQISRSPALQAALLTVINCGQRAFLGGLDVDLPEKTRLLLPWPNRTTLNEVVTDLLYRSSNAEAVPSQTIYFGFWPDRPAKHSLVVNCTGWRGGIEPASGERCFEIGSTSDFALGGVFAGALAVHRGFLRSSAISLFACDESAGVSVWSPGDNWLSTSSEGPAIRALPAGLWLLGLGHLGQAFLWTLGLLPFADPKKCEAVLQDFDYVESANIGTGLLTTDQDIGRRKTRICSDWLEAHHFRTTICERAFDESTRRRSTEPNIALCGFDQSEPRRLLGGANFQRIIECGLGSSVHDFDQIHIHNFPEIRLATQIWTDSKATRANPWLVQALSKPSDICGALAIDVAGKAVSTSFVGAMAAAVVFGEVLRIYHKGQRHHEIYLTPRNLSDSDFVGSGECYRATQAAEFGFCDVQLPVVAE
jgi:hypothetical protein